MITDLGAMHMAIAEGKKGLGFVAPNPPVGCVILSSRGHILAKGYHERYGDPHAEISALNKIKNQTDLIGATLFVTLEPCAHEGQTPSCAKHLATLPLARVVYGLVDPNPVVSGQGVAILQKAKIRVDKFLDLQTELEELAEQFLWNHRHKSIFVGAKVGTSLDGQMALKSGESKWITSEMARLKAQELRAQYDCVLVGKNTVTNDNPSLNIRHPRFAKKRNKVVILDSAGELVSRMNELKLSKVHELSDIYLAVSKVRLSQASNEISDFIATSAIKVLKLNEGPKIDIAELLNALYAEGIRSVFVEGGASTLSSFFSQGLVNRLYQFIAPQIIGGARGVSFASEVSLSSLDQSIRLVNLRAEQVGPDLLVTGRFQSKL